MVHKTGSVKPPLDCTDLKYELTNLAPPNKKIQLRVTPSPDDYDEFGCSRKTQHVQPANCLSRAAQDIQPTTSAAPLTQVLPADTSIANITINANGRNSPTAVTPAGPRANVVPRTDSLHKRKVL